MELVKECAVDTLSDTEQFDLLRQVIEEYGRQESNLIQVLHMAQAIFGYLPENVLHFIAAEIGLPLSRVHGVVSFYSYFATKPRGRHSVQVCLGTACYVRGGKKVLGSLKTALGVDVGQTTDDRRFTLEVKRCIGSCGLAPAVMVDKTVYKRVNPNKLQDILKLYD